MEALIKHLLLLTLLSKPVVDSRIITAIILSIARVETIHSTIEYPAPKPCKKYTTIIRLFLHYTNDLNFNYAPKQVIFIVIQN